MLAGVSQQLLSRQGILRQLQAYKSLEAIPQYSRDCTGQQINGIKCTSMWCGQC